MGLHQRTRHFPFATLLLLSACSSSSPTTVAPTTDGGGTGTTADTGTGPATVGTVPDAFSGYCVATLTVPAALQNDQAANIWVSSSLQAPVGTQFLLGTDALGFSGYVFLSDGTPTRIDTRATPLVLGTSFTSSCAPASPDAGGTMDVLLAPATFYPNMDLSGAACMFPAGATLANYVFVITTLTNGAGGGEVGSSEITAQCGEKLAYTGYLAEANLF